MSKLNEKVWVIRNNIAVEVTLRDLDKHIEISTRPTGVGTKHYVTQVNDKWCHAVWVTYGGPERIIAQFETEQEAISAVEDAWLHDIWNNTEETVYATKEAAEVVLADAIDGL